MVFCPVCKLSYSEDDLNDKLLHEKRHDAVLNGAKCTDLSKTDIIWNYKNMSIIVVCPKSLLLLKQAAALSSCTANIEMRYDRPMYDESEIANEFDKRIFLLLKNDRIIGHSIFEKRRFTYRFSWDGLIQSEYIPELNPIWTVCFIWIHQKFRKNGHAQILISVFIDYFCIKNHTFAWDSPFSSSGSKFVKSWFPENFLISQQYKI